MERLIDRLENHSKIGIDTSIFIYHFEENRKYTSLTSAILEGIQSGKWVGAISVITLMEINVLPFRLQLNSVARTYEVLLANFPNLQIIDVNRDIARKASQLRAEFNFKPADALHISTSLLSGVTAWVSNDKSHSRASEFLEILILDEFVTH